MELYLIAHKVRGEPAFDIAIKLQIGDEEGWIIPTSGHRAYPIRYWKLEDLADVSDYPHNYPAMWEAGPAYWDDLPDHYEITAEKGQGIHVTDGRTLLEQLGLAKPLEPMRRW